MKKLFSTHWSSSTQRRKQRKYIHNAPLHIKHKFLSVNLSKSLRQKYSKRNLPLRTGDEVLVMRGSLKRKKAKVSSIDIKNTRVYLENMQRQKKDGTKVNVVFHPSVLQIQALNLDDKERLSIMNRKTISSSVDEKKEIKQKDKKEKNAPN
nr:50S ribosomal protein L24P [uncultured archaeon]